MKKALSIVLVLLTLASMLCLSASAADESETNADPGGNVFGTNAEGNVTIEGDFICAGVESMDSLKAPLSGSIGGDLLGIGFELDIDGLTIGNSLRGVYYNFTADELSVRNMTLVAMNMTLDSGVDAKTVYAVAEYAEIYPKLDFAQLSCGTLYVYGGIAEGSISGGNVYIEESAEVGKISIESGNEPMVFNKNDPSKLTPYSQTKFKDSITYTKTESDNSGLISGIILSFVTALLTALLLSLILKKHAEKACGALRGSAGRVIGLGLALTLGVPVVAVLMLMFVITLPISAAAMLVYAAVCILSAGYASVILGKAILPNMNGILSSLIFAAGISLLTNVPILGGLISLACLILTFGALTVTLTTHTPEGLPPLNPETFGQPQNPYQV